jgi:hypothetical protein
MHESVARPGRGGKSGGKATFFLEIYKKKANKEGEQGLKKANKGFPAR